MYNEAIIIGHLTAQPELATMSNKESVTHVALTVSRRFKSQNGEHGADFISVVVWERLAEILVSYAGKGSLLSVDSELRTRKHERGGHTNYVTEMLCYSFQLLESRARRAMRENNVADDLADLVLEEEELPL